MHYYKEVGAYYDKDAIDFEKRYWQNSVLQRIRQAFRELTKAHPFHSALEIGFGPGFDLVHFARIFPESRFYGLDVSAEMVKLADAKIQVAGFNHAQVAQGSVEDIARVFPNTKFDLIYVFFGALNTVNNLPNAFKELEKHLEPNGRMCLSFVNKWYLMGMLIELLKGKPKRAFARLNKVWGGYSPTEFLASTCYSSHDIHQMASSAGLLISHQQGFSIFYPAWYYHKLHKKLPKKIRHLLWRLDTAIASGPLGRFGEYAFYELRKVNN